MNGKYITPTGEIKEVVSFDAENKIAMVPKGSGQYSHHNESEYKHWKSIDDGTKSMATLDPAYIWGEGREEPTEVEPEVTNPEGEEIKKPTKKAAKKK